MQVVVEVKNWNPFAYDHLSSRALDGAARRIAGQYNRYDDFNGFAAVGFREAMHDSFFQALLRAGIPSNRIINGWP